MDTDRTNHKATALNLALMYHRQQEQHLTTEEIVEAAERFYAFLSA